MKFIDKSLSKSSYKIAVNDSVMYGNKLFSFLYSLINIVFFIFLLIIKTRYSSDFQETIFYICLNNLLLSLISFFLCFSNFKSAQIQGILNFFDTDKICILLILIQSTTFSCLFLTIQVYNISDRFIQMINLFTIYLVFKIFTIYKFYYKTNLNIIAFIFSSSLKYFVLIFLEFDEFKVYSANLVTIINLVCIYFGYLVEKNYYYVKFKICNLKEKNKFLLNFFKSYENPIVMFDRNYSQTIYNDNIKPFFNNILGLNLEIIDENINFRGSIENLIGSVRSEDINTDIDIEIRRFLLRDRLNSTKTPYKYPENLKNSSFSRGNVKIKTREKALFSDDEYNEKLVKQENFSLINFHEFLLEFSEKFHDFIALLRFDRKSEKYEMQLKILNFQNKPNFIYRFINITEKISLNKLVCETKYKSLYLSKVAHEFKNPILVISDICENLTKKITKMQSFNKSYMSSSDESDIEISENKSQLKSRDDIFSIQESTLFIINMNNYLLCLIQDLNFFAKKEVFDNSTLKSDNSTQNEIFDLRCMVEFCLNIFRYRKKRDENKKSLEIQSFYDRKLPKNVNLPQVKLKQILINLLSNAYKFTVHGFIRVSLTEIEIEEKCYIRFEVSDSGTGIPKNNLKHLCQPFVLSEKNQNINSNGSGLGLYIVKEMLKELNSDLEISSIENKGSTFLFDLELINKIPNNLSNSEILSTTTIKNFEPILSESMRKKFSNCDFHLTLNRLDLIQMNNFLLPMKIESTCSISKKFRKSSRNVRKKISFGEKLNGNRFIRKIQTLNPSKIITQQKCYISSLNHSINEKRIPFNFLSANPKSRQIFRIMICDDDQSVRISLKKVLENQNNYFLFQIDESCNGIECLNKIYNEFIFGIRYDILFIDENMPFMKGSTCSVILNNMYLDGQLYKLKIISISCFENDEFKSFILSQGIDEIYPKPISKNDIFNIIGTLNK